jgi:hypothetical protein
MLAPRQRSVPSGVYVFIAGSILMSIGSAKPGTAQFVTPIPKPPPDSVVQAEGYQAGFFSSLPPGSRDSLRLQQLGPDRIRELRESFCQAQEEDPDDLCEEALDVEDIASNTTLKPRTHTTKLLGFGLPLSHNRFDLTNYLESAAGPDGLALFSRFAANISDDEAYVTTDIITGLAGRVMFGINYAAVVVKDDSGDTEAAQRAIESQKSNIIRMINNGGTITSRLQLPLVALSGPTGQTASSVYTSLGLIGPIGNTDSLKFAGTIVGELVTARSIREFGKSAGILGEVLLGGRIGYAFSEAELLSGTGDKGFPFTQVVFGLLQNNKVSLSFLYTYAFEERYRAFAPKLTANFAAVR